MAWFLLGVLALICFSPLAGLLTQFNWTNFLEIIKDPLFLKSLSATVASSASASVASVAVALFFSRFFALSHWRGKRFQRLLLLFPFLTPNFILAMSFVMAWNPTTGLFNKIIAFPGGLYGLSGMTILFTIVHLPVAFLLIEEKFKRIDSSLREAARLSGARTLTVFFRIEFPLLIPAILNALSLCFALNISAFAIPAWIGAPAHVYPLTYKVYQSVQLGGADGLSDASLYAVFLLFLAMIPFVLGFWIQRNEKKYVLLSGKSSRQGFEEPSMTHFLFFQFCFFASQLFFWIIPLGCLFLSTIVGPGCLQQKGLVCLTSLSFQKYKYVIFGLEETRAAAVGSFLYGGISAFLIIALSLFIVFSLSRHKRKLNIAESISAIPVATPGAIIALGLIVVAGGKYGINLYNTAWIVVAAFVIKHLSFALSPLKSGLANISSSLLEAARVSGASENQVWRKIVFPILQPELLGGFFLVFVPILGELTMSVFLTSPSFKSFGTVLFDLQDYADQASAGAMALLLIVLILILNKLSRILSHGKLGY